MRRPKSIQNAESKISEDLLAEKLEICRKYLWNDAVSADEANKAINDYNERYLAAGGTSGGCIVNK